MARWLLPTMLLLTGMAYAQTFNSFETPAEMAAFSPSGLEATQVTEHATQGEHSLLVTAKGSEKDSWPGLILTPANPDLSGVAILAFDVFNPMDRPVDISYRMDDGSGKNVFLGSRAAPGQSTQELWLTSHRFELDMRNITRIYPYFRMPRQDITLYFDNFRFTTMAARFKPIVFEETAPSLEPAEVDVQRGYVIFNRHWLSSVFPNSRPLPGEMPAELEVFGTPGQVVPVTLCVRALKDLGETAVTAADLKGDKGLLPATAIKICPVSYRDKRLVYSSDWYIRDMPTILEERPSVAVPAERTQLYWANVTIPADAAAGVYSGVLQIKPAQGAAAEVPLQVRVLPYRLAQPKHMLWGEYYLKPTLAKTMKEQKAAIEHDLADQRAHGMTSVGLCFGLENGDFKVEGTRVTVAPAEDGLYVHLMETYKKLGFMMPIVQLNDAGQTAAGAFPFGTPEWVETYKSFWIEMAKVQKERGWPELIVQPVDEPAWQGPDERGRNLACLKWLKEIPGQRTEIDGPVDGYFLSEVGPLADVWNGNGTMPEPKAVKQAQAQGKIVTSYNNDVESYRPEMGRYCNGFYQLRAGTRGTYNWAYISFAGSPYDDQDADTGSWMHWYPPMPDLGEVGGPSTGWEGARAGVDDYRYAFTLQQAIRRAQASKSKTAKQAARQGQVVLDSILASINYRPQTRGTAAFAEEKAGPDGSKIVHGALKLPNGWDFETYDRARWQLASATMAIMSALHELPAQGARKAPAREAATDLVQEIRWSDRPGETAGSGQAQKQLSIPMLTQAPVIDGDIADPAWQQAGKIDGFTRMDGSGPPAQQTHVWMGSDDKNLYVAVECLEEHIKGITARVNEEGGSVWEDDCVELFIDSTLQRSTFRQIVINSLGKMYFANGQDRTWKPEVQRATKVDVEGKRWLVEMSIPLPSLGLTSNVFGFNICRERRPLEVLELSCWSPTGSGFAVPSRFGVATIGGSYLQDFRLGQGTIGSNQLGVTVRNDGKEQHNFIVMLDWKQGKKVALYRQKGPLTLAPGQTADVALNYEVTSDQAPLALMLTVKDADTGAVYAQRQIEQQILPALKVTLKPSIYYLRDDYGQLQLDLHIDEALAEKALVLMAIFEAGATKPVRKQVLPADAQRLDAVLNVRGLPAGTYRVEAVLKTDPEPGAQRLATQKTVVTKVVGPFD